MSENQLLTLQNQIRTLFPTITKRQTYQKLLVAYMSVSWIMSTWIFMVGSFVFMNPLFECNGQSATEKDACAMIDQCKITNDFTAAYYCQLYCDRQYQRTIIQSFVFVGSFLSILTLLPQSDLRGRRYCFRVTMGLGVVSAILTILGIYIQNWIIIAIGQIFNGLYQSGQTLISYVITGELANDKIRQKSVMIYCSMWGFGQMCFVLFYYFLNEWYNFMILVVGLPITGLFIISLFFLIETPDYCLFIAKDYKKLEETLDYLDMYNQAIPQNMKKFKQLSVLYIQKFKQNNQSKKVSSIDSYKKLFKQKKILLICICLGLFQSSFSFYYYGMQGSMQRTGFNFGISMLLAGVHQFIGYLIVTLIAQKVARKKGLFITIIISVIFGLSLILPFIKNSEILESIIVSLARLTTVFTYSFYALLQTQSFPTSIKGTGIGLSDGIGQISKITVPYMISIMNNLGIHPLIFSSIVYLILGAIPLKFIKQTKKQQIKQSDQKQKSQNETKQAQQQIQINKNLLQQEINQTNIKIN